VSVAIPPKQLFNRAWAVTIGDPSEPSSAKLYASPQSAPVPTARPGAKGQSTILTADGKAPTGLRVSFEIDKTSASTSNKAKIDVYNFSALSRLHYRRGFQIQLQAGYFGAISTIFVGDIPEGPKGATTKRKGADLVTTFECGETERNIVFSRFDQSYPPKTPIITIFNDLAAALDVDLGSVSGITQEYFNSGVSLSGSVKSSLDKLCSKQGLEWNIQNGHLRIYPIRKPVDTAIVLTKSTGLINVPSQGGQFLTFEALLNPALMPGALVQIKSTTVSGFFKIKRSLFQGDSEGDKWQVSCEAFQIDAISLEIGDLLPQQNFNGRIIA
jgi:hypothetical protein